MGLSIWKVPELLTPPRTFFFCMCFSTVCEAVVQVVVRKLIACLTPWLERCTVSKIVEEVGVVYKF